MTNRLAVFGLLPAAICLSCGRDEAHRTPAPGGDGAGMVTQSGTRTVLVDRWDTVFHVGGAGDTVLLLPRLLAAGHRRVHAFDYGDRAVKTFDDRGRLLWASGRPGRGPAEFRNAMAMDVGPDGRLWIVDTGAGRMPVLAPDGSFERMLPVPANPTTAVVPRRGGAITLGLSMDSFWIRIDTAGRILGSGATPLRHLAAVHPYSRGALARGTADGIWAAAFPHGDRLLVFRDTVLRCQAALIEAGPFPAAPTADATIWVAGLAVSDTSVFLLPRGTTEDHLRLVDVYSTSDCRYRGSHRLPRRMLAMAYADGIFYFEYEDPEPAIIGLRPVAEPRDR